MSTTEISSPGWRTPPVILIAGTAILMIAMGVRMSYGLFLAPASKDLGWGLTELSFAMALQALLWGVATPVAGSVADRYGAGRVLTFAGTGFAAGLALMAYATSTLEAVLSIGVLTGFAMGACTFPIILSVISRAVPDPRKRAVYTGIASSAGSSGQFVVLPITQHVLDGYGWINTLFVLAAISALIVPCAAALAGRNRAEAAGNAAAQSLGAALREAGGHGGYLLLNAGYFVCGFQTLFIATHLPGMLQGHPVSGDMGAWAISLIGLFNVFGCFFWGALSGRRRIKYLLSVIYALRAVVMAGFLLLPITNLSTQVFAALMGLLWLGTVPLTGAVVAQIFGVRYMGTLFGFTFLSHQLGSFIGILAGGYLFDLFGNYNVIWWAGAALGIVAAGLHLPIDDRPLARAVAQPA